MKCGEKGNVEPGEDFWLGDHGTDPSSDVRLADRLTRLKK